MNYVLIFHKLCRNSCRIVVECPIFKYFPYHYPSYAIDLALKAIINSYICASISRFRSNQYCKQNIFCDPLVVFSFQQQLVLGFVLDLFTLSLFYRSKSYNFSEPISLFSLSLPIHYASKIILVLISTLTERICRPIIC